MRQIEHAVVEAVEPARVMNWNFSPSRPARAEAAHGRIVEVLFQLNDGEQL
jgi:hypothetical protein